MAAPTSASRAAATHPGTARPTHSGFDGNAALRAFQRGYHVVSVIPPGATLTAGSKIRPEALGKIPGRQSPSGQWHGYPFTTEPAPDAAACAEIDNWGANVGVLADHTPALDIDSESQALTDLIVQQAERRFGPAPFRSSRPTRGLLMYRTDEPFKKLALLVTDSKDRTHTLEWLCEGRQYVIAGQHPSGVPYAVDRLPEHDTLPLVTGDEARDFLESLRDLFESKGLECEIIESAPKTPAPPQEELAAPDLEALSRVVRQIPNRFASRDEWIEVLYAIKAAGAAWPTEARDLALEFSARWEDGTNDPDLTEREFDSLTAPYRVGYDRLCALAEEAGERDPAETASETFEADPTAEPPAKEDPAAAPAADRHTDVWIAEKVAPSLRSALRFGGESRVWYHWTGCRWEPVPDVEADQIVTAELVRFAARLNAEADGCASEKEARKPRSTALHIQSDTGIRQVTNRLKGLLALREEDLDADPWILNTPGGEVDLRTGRLRPASPDNLCSRAAATAPESGPCPKWERFVQDLAGEDGEYVGYLKRLLGYCLTGKNTEKVVHFAVGTTDTSKSTLIRAVSQLLGGYAGEIDPSALMQSGRSANSKEDALARIRPLRFLTANEPRSGSIWDEQTIKAISGGDRIEARPLRGHTVTYAPQFKLFVAGNREPNLEVADPAMLRRIRLLPFDHQIPKSEQIAEYDAELVREEGPAILQWMIEGCLEWRKAGLQSPERVRLRTERYASEESLFEQFLEDRCVLDPEAFEYTDDVFEAWRHWCFAAGEKPGRKRDLNREFDAHPRLAYTQERRDNETRSRGRRIYRGVKLRVVDEAFAAA